MTVVRVEVASPMEWDGWWGDQEMGEERVGNAILA